jgi:hypothetical protein
MTRAAVLQTPSKDPNEIPMAQVQDGGDIESRCPGGYLSCLNVTLCCECRFCCAEVKQSERDGTRVNKNYELTVVW